MPYKNGIQQQAQASNAFSQPLLTKVYLPMNNTIQNMMREAR